MKYIVYLTTNKVNNKIYIGVHGTENPEVFDTYLGNGIYTNSPKSYQKGNDPLHHAVAKYGPQNFHRTTLKIFDNLEDALDLERWLVCPSFIERTDTYNVTLGGGMPPNPEKTIYQYSLEGDLIKEWDSIKSITNYFNVNKDRIRMAINDKRSFEASYWSEEQFEKLNLKEYRPSSRGSIRQYTTTGTFLKSFKNTTEAAKALDIDRNKITNAVYGKYATEGYWFLKEDETIESYLDGSIKNEKPIYMYDLDGNFEKKYSKFSELKKDFKLNKPDLKRAIKNSSEFFEHFWSHFKYDNFKIDNPEYIINIPRKVYQYDKNGNLIKEWESINVCKKEFPSVLQVCLGNRNHCKGFKFSFDKLKILSDTVSNNGLTK